MGKTNDKLGEVNNRMISVVMATYNGEKYIKEQLQSILKQTRIPDEIVISDDASTDCTIEEINKMISSTDYRNIKLYQNNKRLGYARNFAKAIGLARGNYIFLSDQDDIWNKKKIEIMEGILADNPNIQLLSSSFNLIGETGNQLINGKANGVLREIKKNQFFRHPKYPGMAMAFRRELWDTITDNRKQKMVAHDWLLGYTASDKNGFYQLNKPLCNYRQHSSNESGTIQSSSGRNKIQQRIRTINGLIDNMSSIADEECKELSWIKGYLEFQNKRKEILLDKKRGLLLAYLMRNKKYISWKSILGDFYTLI